MPDRTAHRHRAALRPVPDYEPRVDLPRPATAADGQLVLPLQRSPGQPPHRRSSAVDRPSDDSVAQLLRALVEVADGRRPVDGLRKQLSFAVHGQLRNRRATPISGLFTIRRVRSCVLSDRRLEVCATVHNPPRPRAFATLATLERQRTDWLVTSFAMLLPTAATAAARHAG